MENCFIFLSYPSGWDAVVWFVQQQVKLTARTANVHALVHKPNETTTDKNDERYAFRTHSCTVQIQALFCSNSLDKRVDWWAAPTLLSSFSAVKSGPCWCETETESCFNSRLEGVWLKVSFCWPSTWEFVGDDDRVQPLGSQFGTRRQRSPTSVPFFLELDRRLGWKSL